MQHLVKLIVKGLGLEYYTCKNNDMSWKLNGQEISNGQIDFFITISMIWMIKSPPK
jgi:hypothetical protein